MVEWLGLATGLFVGISIPHSPVYTRISCHFIKCINKRDQKIKELNRVILILKLQLIKHNNAIKKP